jgi:hypothetical protein
MDIYGGAPTIIMNDECPEGMGWRVSVSILTLFGLIGFLVIWLFFFADGFSIYQNIAVVMVGILAFVAINGAAWAPWGMRHGKECGRRHGRSGAQDGKARGAQPGRKKPKGG